MISHADFTAAPSYRIEVSMTRSESLSVLVEGPLEERPSGAPSDREPTASATSRLKELPLLPAYRLPLTKHHERREE